MSKRKTETSPSQIPGEEALKKRMFEGFAILTPIVIFLVWITVKNLRPISPDEVIDGFVKVMRLIERIGSIF